MDIDFVVPWVDSTDPEWIDLYRKYRKEEHKEDRARFRTWDIFHYWFRAVEQYAPWVHKVFLITNGTFPDWINPNHPKLVLVKHSDYIPKEYLPTFNSSTIELNISKIKGLSEHFVYFNDDIFLNSPISPDYYFHEGLPCDNNEELLFIEPRYSKQDLFGIQINQYVNIAFLNQHFRRRESIRNSPKRWFGSHLGIKQIILSLLIFRGRDAFEDFKIRHFEQPYLKSVLNEVLLEEKEMIKNSCTRFRQATNLTQYLFRYWQIASNRFYPVKLKYGTCFTLTLGNLDEVCETLRSNKMKSVCLNDTPYCSDADYKIIEQGLISAFEEKFPKKSSFEK